MSPSLIPRLSSLFSVSFLTQIVDSLGSFTWAELPMSKVPLESGELNQILLSFLTMLTSSHGR